jgi:hypothetical protein
MGETCSRCGSSDKYVQNTTREVWRLGVDFALTEMNCGQIMGTEFNRPIKANLHIQCRAPAVLYRVAKDLDCVFLIRITQ